MDSQPIPSWILGIPIDDLYFSPRVFNRLMKITASVRGRINLKRILEKIEEHLVEIPPYVLEEVQARLEQLLRSGA